MSYAGALQGLPTFPTSMLMQSPILSGRISIPTNLYSNDPFAKGTAVRTLNPIDSFVVSNNVQDISEHPSRHLHILNRHLRSLSDALGSGDPRSAHRSLEGVIEELQTPVAPFDNHGKISLPLYMQLDGKGLGGRDMLRDAALIAAGFAGSEEIPDDIERVHGLLSETDINAADRFKAGLMRAYDVMLQALSAPNPQSSLFNRAERIVDEVLKESDEKIADASVKKDAHFFGNILRLEILSGLLVLASTRKDRKSRKAYAKQICDTFKALKKDHGLSSGTPSTTEEAFKTDLLGKYYADISILMARLGLWNHAIERARTLTTSEGLRETGHAERLLKHELFQPFIDHERGAHGEIKLPGEIRRNWRDGWLKRYLIAGIQNAHSRGMAQSAAIGGTGLIAGNLLDTFIQGGHGALFAIGGAMVFSGIYRYVNGLMTDEARDAISIGGNEMPPRIEIVKDMGRLALRSGLDAVAWSVPAIMLDAGTEALKVGFDTLAYGYGKYSDWLGSAASAIRNPDTYAALANAAVTTAGDPMLALKTLFQLYSGASGALAALHAVAPGVRPYTQKFMPFALPGIAMLGTEAAVWAMNSSATELLSGAYNAYTKAAGVLFASHILFPGLRPDIDRISKWFLPGAIGLAADIRQSYKYDVPLFSPDVMHPDWINGVVRASIVSAEAMIMMLVTGMIAWKKGDSPLGTIKNFGKALHDVPKSLPITIAIVNGITSPFGGAMQKDTYDALSLIMMQGIATTLGVLPFTLLISGLLKGKVPLYDAAKEAFQDSRGLPAHKRIQETLLGLTDAVRQPYTKNRTGRIFLYDPYGAAARTYFGWDLGFFSQIAQAVPNVVAGNPASTLTWPEPSGSKWERTSIQDLFSHSHAELGMIGRELDDGELSEDEAQKAKKAVMEKIHMAVSKAGQAMDPFHLFAPHQSLADRLLPLYAVRQSVKPTDFPSQTNPYYFASIHRMLKGGNIAQMVNKGSVMLEELKPEHVEILLDYVKSFSKDAGAYRVIRPLVTALALARDNPETGQLISNFFDDNPWIQDLLDIDVAKLEPPKEISRRRTKYAVMKQVATSRQEYLERVSSHGNPPKIDELYQGLFVDTPPEAPPPKVQAALDDGLAAQK